MESYNLKLESFEGPLDLLFHLIEKNKINIYDIPIAKLTDQYMDYLYEMQELNLELASEFLVLAATLLHIKSKMLLPKKVDPQDEEEEDPREVLIRKLIEYKKHKKMAKELFDREKEYAKLHYKLPEVYTFDKVYAVEDLSAEELAEAYKRILLRNAQKMNETVQERVDTIVKVEKVTLRSKIRQVMQTLVERSAFRFSELFGRGKVSKTERVTGFMAVLELTRTEKVKLEQEQLFSEITVQRCDDPGDLNEESYDILDDDMREAAFSE